MIRTNAAIGDVSAAHKLGRGSSLEFVATDADVQRWLIDALPQVYAPYSLIGEDWVAKGETGSWKPFEFEASSFLKEACSDAPAERERTKFWLRSRVLTPEVNLAAVPSLSAWLILNGLPDLDHGRWKKTCVLPSGIGIVWRVLDERTSDVHEHLGYRQVFLELKKHVQRDLVYSTIRRFPNGTERELDAIRMTADAATSESRPPFCDRPGRRIAARSRKSTPSRANEAKD